jgi:diacylglycerol kinase (ATP)|tara:strand:- start:2329 stop:3219 length:891 start_codon:yes stop_codon:yes gene_type:complete
LANYTLLVNCRSNSSRAEEYIKASESLIYKKLPDCEIKYISSPIELTTEAARSALSSSVVIACGGDGTAQSVARGVHCSNAVMGLIPVGSGNDFAKAIGLKPRQSIEYYLEVILQHQLINIDIPVINGQVFINTTGIGFDGLTNYYASQFNFLKGMMKYTLSGLKAFFTAQPVRIYGTVDESDFDQRVWLIAIANGAVEGGKYLISPKSLNSDGVLEMVVVPAYSRLKLGMAFILLSFGRSLSAEYSEVISFEKAEFKITDLHYIHLDGENGPSSNKYKIELSKDMLSVIGDLSDG